MTATKHTTAPASWKPNNPEAIARWMKKLPVVYDIEEVKKIDRKYEQLQALAAQREELV